MSVRAQILDALKTRLEGIATPTYNVDVGAVYIHRVKPIDPDEDAPVINIRDSEFVDVEAHGEEMHYLSLLIDLLAGGDTAIETVRDLEEDVITAIQVDDTFGGLADIMTIARESAIELEVAEQIFARTELTVTIEYATALYTA